MTLESDSPRTELIKVESVQNGMSRDGMTPQYIVGYTWQYSQYPSNLYVPQSEAPDPRWAGELSKLKDLLANQKTTV